MKHTGKGSPVMKTSSNFSGNALGDCLRAAEADANRFHGVQAPKPWQGGRLNKGKVLAASVALLATAAAMLLALRPTHVGPPPPTVAATPPAPHPWFTSALSDETADAEPVPRAPASYPPATTPAANSTSAVIPDTASPVTLDGGDVDLAAIMPASVLTGPPEGSETPRIAPMNVPTVPDDNDKTPAEPDPVSDMPSTG